MPDTTTQPGEPASPVGSAGVSASLRDRLKEWPRGWAPDVFLLALGAIVCALTALRLQERIASGPSWDTYAFLDNAADMAGKSVGYIEPHRPPMMSFLTSLVLRMGFWNVASIQVLDGVLTVIGVIAFYLLLRRRFERPLAMAASILLLLVPPLWTWLGSGYTDFPSVALSICALLCFVKATEDDPRWYWVAFPLLLFAILTRFGAILMILPACLWMALRAKPFRQAKQIATGIGLAALAYVPAGLYYFKYFSDPFFPFAFAGNVADAGLSGASKAAAVPAYLAALPGKYFLKNVASLLLTNGMDGARTIFLVLTLVGLAAAAIGALARQRPAWRRWLPLAATALIVLTEFRGSTLVRAGAITLLGFVIGTFVLPREEESNSPEGAQRPWPGVRKLNPGGALALDATILVWGLLFFDAHGHMQPQIDRYFITMAPAALYFVSLGWRTLGTPLTALVRAGSRAFAENSAWRRGWLVQSPAVMSLIGVLVLGAMATASGANVLGHHNFTGRGGKDPIVLGAEKSANWLVANDRSIRGKTIYSDVWPLTSWYLGMEAYPMPTFESAKAFPHELEKNKVDYFVTIRSRGYPGYKSVYGAASTRVLKYESTFPRAEPAVAYLGDGWDAYAEQLCNFDFDFYFSNRRQLGLGTWMLDGLTPEQLAQYDAVAIFGAHWRNKGVAEQTLRTYVERGGVVILDASHNMDGFSYPLVDTVFMDVLVRRGKVSPSAEMTISPALAAESRLPTSFALGSMVDEGNGPWYGAEYEPATWAPTSGQSRETFEVLASINKKPAILLQRIGKGRIYWVSDNLTWHAYLEGNDNEVRLIRGLFRDAVGLPPTPAAEVAVGVKPWFISRKLRSVQAATRPKPPTRSGVASSTLAAAAAASTVASGALR